MNNTCGPDNIQKSSEAEDDFVDPYKTDFRYLKRHLVRDEDNLYFPVDYERLQTLLDAYPSCALELAILCNAVDLETGKLKEDFEQDCMQDYIEWQLMEVVDLVSKFGLSGGMAPFFFNALFPLLKKDNIKPLLGKDWEWVDVSRLMGKPEGTTFQNRRFTSIFKDGKDGQAHWSEGKVFSDDHGENWYIRGGGESSVPITFPCVTRSLQKIYIMEDTIEEELVEEAPDVQI